MVKIIADTLSCLSLERAREIDVDIIPQIIEFPERSYRDDTEIDSATFLKKLLESKISPKTAAPPPAMYEPYFRQYSAEGHTILIICPSAQMSGTVRSAQVAAQDFPQADIRVIDTNSVAAALGTMVEKAAEWAKQGMDADTIEANINKMAARACIYFLVDTLEYLQRGGRIGKAQALVGSLLQVKPILTIHDGHTESLESQRTKRKAIARLCELVHNECPPGGEGYLSLLQGGAEDEAAVLAEEFKQSLGLAEVPIYFLPPAVLVHSGPGALGVTFFRKA
jgi:DegV family protein with EDD domain